MIERSFFYSLLLYLIRTSTAACELRFRHSSIIFTGHGGASLLVVMINRRNNRKKKSRIGKKLRASRTRISKCSLECFESALLTAAFEHLQIFFTVFVNQRVGLIVNSTRTKIGIFPFRFECANSYISADIGQNFARELEARWG